MRSALTVTNAALIKAKATAANTGSPTALKKVETLEKKAANQKVKRDVARERLKVVEAKVGCAVVEDSSKRRSS